MIRELDCLPYEDKLRGLGLFSVEKRMLWGDLTLAFQYLRVADRTAGEGVFPRACSNRTRGNGCKLKEGSFRWKFFTVRMERHRNWLPRESADAPSLSVFKAGLDRTLSNLV